MRRHQVKRADRILGRVRLIGVDGEVGIRTELGADRGHPGHVLFDIAIDLDLEMPDALVRERPGILCHVRRRLDRQDAKRREFSDRRAAEKIAYRHGKSARQQVVQGAIDSGFRLVVPGHGSVEVVENAGDLTRVAPDETLAEEVEGALHGLMRRTIVSHRGGVSVSNGAVFSLDADDPALCYPARRKGEFPVLVLLRQNRLVDARLDDLHPVSPSPQSRPTDAGSGQPFSFTSCSHALRCWAAFAGEPLWGSRSPTRSMRGSSSSLIAGKSLT